MRDGTPTISVCIPYYEGARTIFMSVASVYAQTIKSNTPAMDEGLVEVIINSDDTSDQAREVLARLQSAFKVKVYFNEQRLGLTGNWQAALARGEGKVVTLLHQDDWYAPGCLEVVAERFAADPGLVFLAFNATLDGRGDKVQVKLDSFEWKGRQLHAAPQELDLVFAPSVTFFRQASLKGLKTLYHDAYKWSPERELNYNLARANPGSRFAFDARPLVARGIGKGQFSVNNEDLRLQDLLTFWQRVSKAEPDKDEPLGRYVLTQVLERMTKWLNTVRSSDPSGLMLRSRWLKAIYADPRFGVLAERYPEIVESALVAQAKGGVNMGALNSEAYHAASGAAAFKAVADRVIGEAMAGGAAKLERVRSRMDRILASPAFDAPVVICGFHHSGTRLLAQMLEAIGVFQHCNSPTHEWSYIQHLNTMLLPGWMDPEAIDAYAPTAARTVLDRERLALRIAAAGYMGYEPWGQKDPRNSITADAWLELFPNARLINIVRDPMDVLGTLPADYSRFSPSGERPQDAPAFWGELWNAYTRKTRAAMDRAGRAVEVRFQDLCDQPVDTMRRIVDALGLDCSVQAQDFEPLNILPAKVGAHQAWMADGRLGEAEAQTLRRITGALPLDWRPPSRPKRTLSAA